MLYHTHTTDEVLAELKTTTKGLHQIYAEERLARYGYNHLRLSRLSLWRIIIEPFRSAMMLILLVALGCTLVAGRYTETVLVALIILLSAVVGYVQSFSTERTLRTLERQAVGRSRVRRDGITASIEAVELVPGDIVLLSQGDRIPADGRILHSTSFYSNELQLTGETEPVAKHNKIIHSESELTSRSNMVYRGSYVVSGSAQFVVTATGNRTEYGKLLRRVSRSPGRSTLQHKIDRLTHKLTVVVLSVAALLLIVSLARGMEFEQAIIYTIAIIVAAVPAILTVAVALIVSLALRRMSQHHALVRSMQALELTSMISMVAADKTGMLTRDTLTVADSWYPQLSPSQFARYAAHSTLLQPYEQDQIDISLLKQFGKPTSQHSAPLKSFLFDRLHNLSGNLRHQGAQYDLTLKGAPEKILRLSDMTDNEHEQALHHLHQLTGAGYQVLALAHATLSQPITNLAKLNRQHTVTFVGLIAFKQQFRPDSKHAIAAAIRAGVAVSMVTGDHVETAYYLARQLGVVASRDHVLDARKLAVMSDTELGRVVRHTTVFARMTPTQKHRLLSALRRHHVVAITGHGTDDLPALLQAHVGVSTASSSVLARDASELILLDNKFSTILEAIKWSRTTLGNIRRMFLYLMTTNMAEMATVAGSLLLGVSPALLPVQILWINLVTNAGLVLPLGLEPHSRNIMKRKPVSPRAGILPRYLVVRMCVIAGVMAIVSVASFVHYSSIQSVAYAQTLVFQTFVVMQIVSALSARSDHTSTLVRFRTMSPLLYLGIAATVLVQLIVISSPLGRHMLGLVAVDTSDLFTSTLIGAMAVTLVSELLKWHSRRTVRSKGGSYA